jgi:hypothetical protein
VNLKKRRNKIKQYPSRQFEESQMVRCKFVIDGHKCGLDYELIPHQFSGKDLRNEKKTTLYNPIDKL